jgi:hypothetical protein
MKIKTDVRIFYDRMRSKVSANKERGQKVLDMTVIKDSGRFVPFESGTLEKSAMGSSKIGSGLVVYNTPYAKSQYYGKFDHTKNKHPQATRLWFEAAKAENLEKWIRIVQEAITGKIQRFINENAGLVPKIQLEFITKQTYPSALIKSGTVNVIRSYLNGGGAYTLTFYLSYRGQSFGDKEAAFKWLGAVRLFLEEASKPRLFRKEEFKDIADISGIEIGEGIRVKGAGIEQNPIDVYGQDKDGVTTYQSAFSLKFIRSKAPFNYNDRDTVPWDEAPDNED